MKQKILPLLAFAVAMLVSITANAQGKKITVEPTQKAQLEKFMPVQINNISPKPFNLKQSKKSATPMTMAGKKKDFANAKMVTNHRSAKTAKRQIKASANNNITIGDFYASTYDTEYYISMTDEASTMQFLFDINTTTADFELGKTYTLEDMYVDYTGIGDADDWYVWTVVTAATYTETKDAQGLTHVVASMTDEEGNTYNITYDQPTPSPKEFVADDLLQEDYETDMYLVLKNAASDTTFYFDIYYTGSFEYGKTYTVEDMDSYYSTMEAGGYYNDYKEASMTVTEDKDGLTHIVATVTLKNGEIYNITYDEKAPITPSDNININVSDATLTNRLTAGYWTIDGQTADKNNSVMLYFISKGLQGTFTDVKDFYDYYTYVTDKSTGSNVYYENLSAVNITSKVVGDSLVIEGTMTLSDSKGNPVNVTLHVSTPFTQTWGEWTDFAPFNVNTGKYTFNTLGTYTQPKVQVQTRKDNTGMKQYVFKNWGAGYFDGTGMDLTLNMNPDYTFSFTSDVINLGIDVTFQDVATAYNNPAYTAYNYYDPENGVFNFYTAVVFAEDGNIYTAAKETMVMDKPILERDTVDIVSTKLNYSDYLASNALVIYYAQDVPGYNVFRVTSANATSVDGTFKWSENGINDPNSYFSTDGTDRNYFQDGEFTVVTEGKNIALTGWMIGTDEKYYRLDMSYTVPTVRDTLYFSGENLDVMELTDPSTEELTGWMYDMSDTNTGYEFLLQSKVLDNKFGTFSYEDETLGDDYYNVYEPSGNMLIFKEGSATVAEVGDSIVLDGEFVANDEKVYVLHFAIAPNKLLTAGNYEITANITANEGVEVPAEMQKYLGGYTAQGEIYGNWTFTIYTSEEGFMLNGYEISGDAVILNDKAEVVYGDKHFQLGDAAGNTNGKLAITKTGEYEYALADGTIVYMGNVVGTVTGITFKMIEDPTTAINSVDAKAVKSGKFLENGKLVIIKNGVKYGVAGQVK